MRFLGYCLFKSQWTELNTELLLPDHFFVGSPPPDLTIELWSNQPASQRLWKNNAGLLFSECIFGAAIYTYKRVHGVTMPSRKTLCSPYINHIWEHQLYREKDSTQPSLKFKFRKDSVPCWNLNCRPSAWQAPDIPMGQVTRLPFKSCLVSRYRLCWLRI